jgi:hypothetical protein
MTTAPRFITRPREGWDGCGRRRCEAALLLIFGVKRDLFCLQLAYQPCDSVEGLIGDPAR